MAAFTAILAIAHGPKSLGGPGRGVPPFMVCLLGSSPSPTSALHPGGGPYFCCISPYGLRTIPPEHPLALAQAGPLHGAPILKPILPILHLQVGPMPGA